MTNGDENKRDAWQLAAESKARLDGIDQRLDEFMGWMRRIEDKVEHALQTAMKRPGWPVVVIITFLSSACVGLIMTLINMKNNT